MDPQGLCDFLYVFERNVPFSPFDSADIRSVKATQIGKSLLREAFLLSESPDLRPKFCFDVSHDF